MRLVDGLKVEFLSSERYFESMHTASMYSTGKYSGADLVLLLAPGKTDEDVSDDDIRKLMER